MNQLYDSKGVCILKCIIPNGSKYYKGDFRYRDKNYLSFASEKLLPIELI